MYGTVAGADAYHAARGNLPWEWAEVWGKEQALERASDYIQYRYVARLLPGYDATLPIVEPATYIAALIELATPGFFSKTFTPAEQKVLTEVKGIKWTVTGDASRTTSSTPVSTMIDAMFDPFVSADDGYGFMLRSIGGGDACV